MATCERCGKRWVTPMEMREFATCDDCRDAMEEAAYERRHDGGGGPVTIQDRYEADVRKRMEMRRHDGR